MTMHDFASAIGDETFAEALRASGHFDRLLKGEVQDAYQRGKASIVPPPVDFLDAVESVVLDFLWPDINGEPRPWLATTHRLMLFTENPENGEMEWRVRRWWPEHLVAMSGALDRDLRLHVDLAHPGTLAEVATVRINPFTCWAEEV